MQAIGQETFGVRIPMSLRRKWSNCSGSMAARIRAHLLLQRLAKNHHQRCVILRWNKCMDTPYIYRIVFTPRLMDRSKRVTGNQKTPPKAAHFWANKINNPGSSCILVVLEVMKHEFTFDIQILWPGNFKPSLYSKPRSLDQWWSTREI